MIMQVDSLACIFAAVHHNPVSGILYTHFDSATWGITDVRWAIILPCSFPTSFMDATWVPLESAAHEPVPEVGYP
jgi:hypothetical protein